MGRLEKRIIQLWDEYAETSVDGVLWLEDDYEVTPRTLIHDIIEEARKEFPKIHSLEYRAYSEIEHHCITLDKAIERWFEE